MRSTSITLIALFLVVFSVYYATAPRDRWAGDSLFNALTAWQLGTNGTVYLGDQVYITGPVGDQVGSWIMAGPGGLVSIYPPGTAVLAAPIYALVRGPSTRIALQLTETTAMLGRAPPLTPATIVSAASTAIAVAAMCLLLGKAGATRKEALIGALVFAFATGAWSVSSQRLWAHGPAMMWLALGLCLRETNRIGFAGLTDVAAIVTRPPTIIIGATRAIAKALRARRLMPLLPDAIWLIVGLAILAIYNVAVLQTDPVLGGYANFDAFRFTNPDIGWWIGNIAGALWDPRRGLLTISPFILVLVPGVRAAWRSADPWIRDAALGGLLYFVLHNKAHDFVGGDTYFGYRYPLEAVVVVGPFLFRSYLSWIKGHTFRVLVLLGAVAAAVLLQAFGVVNQFG